MVVRPVRGHDSLYFTTSLAERPVKQPLSAAVLLSSSRKQRKALLSGGFVPETTEKRHLALLARAIQLAPTFTGLIIALFHFAHKGAALFIDFFLMPRLLFRPIRFEYDVADHNSDSKKDKQHQGFLFISKSVLPGSRNARGLRYLQEGPVKNFGVGVWRLIPVMVQPRC